jgi:hypothetical protein
MMWVNEQHVVTRVRRLLIQLTADSWPALMQAVYAMQLPQACLNIRVPARVHTVATCGQRAPILLV